jgi:hypothetical protein
MVNKLPNIDTDVPSNVGGTSGGCLVKAKFSRTLILLETTAYLDDFEGAQTTFGCPVVLWPGL